MILTIVRTIMLILMAQLIPNGTEVKVEFDGYARHYTVLGYIEEDGHLFNHYLVRCCHKDANGNEIRGTGYKTVIEKNALEAYYKDAK